MTCSKCGKENNDGSKFCYKCGAALSSAGQQPPQKKKFSRKALLLGILGCLVIVSAFAFKAYSKYSTYQLAISNLDNKSYADAITAFEDLGDYKDSASYLEKAKMGRKYAILNQNIDSGSADGITIIDSTDAAEETLSELYKEWYDSENGESLTIDALRIDGRDYMVKYVTEMDGFINVEFCYVDEPEHTLELHTFYEYFDYISEYVDTLSIYDLEAGSSKNYVAVTLDEYNQLIAENDEIAAQQPYYSDEYIIDRTFAVFKDRARGAYANGAASLYQSADYSDAYVSYDWTTKIYTCTMTCEYTSNIFDMWGTSTDTYFVTAQFLDNGSNLSMVGLQIS